MFSSKWTALLTVALAAGSGAWASAQTASERPVITTYTLDGIAIPSLGVATPYPSSQTTPLESVASTSYLTLEKVSVTVHGFTHTFPDDVWVLLTHADAISEGIVLMGGAGGDQDVTGLTITFDPDAPTVLPDATALTSGTYRPASYGAAPAFSAPAPPGPYVTTLNDLRGAYAGFGWKLWIYDATGGDSGAIDSWSMTFHCRTSEAAAWDLVPFNVPDSGEADRYPSMLNVWGVPGPVQSVWLRLGLQHSYPRDLDLLLTAPNGTSCVLMSDCGGSFTTEVWNLMFGDGCPPVPAPITDTSCFAPTDLNDGSADVWPAPAPLPPYFSTLSAFSGGTPNGTWRLWVMDDTGGDTGAIKFWQLHVNGRVFCSADFNKNGAVSVQDIFDFLAAYFAGCP